MSMTLRSAATMFLGIPPIFGRARTQPAPRIEPVMPSPAAPKIDRGIDKQKILANARRAAPVELSIIEWDGDAQVAPSCDVASAIEDDPRTGEARCRRIRDRYIGARFPGVARCAADLADPRRVIKAARLYFEDGQADSGLELLELAIGQDSRAEALWLAQLEILFLVRETPRYVEAARAYRALHPAAAAWAEVARLGRALAPNESLFGPGTGPREHDHYGPWPDLPNWIEASWDLTGEVVAADFHRVLQQRNAS